MQYLWGKSSPRRCFASRAESASWQTGWHFTSGVWGTTGEKQNRQSWQHDELVFKKLEESGEEEIAERDMVGNLVLIVSTTTRSPCASFLCFFLGVNVRRPWKVCQKVHQYVKVSLAEMHGDWCSLTMERVGVKHVIYPSPLHHYCNSCCWCAVRLENENFHQRIKYKFCKFETLTGYLLYHVSWWWCEHCHCSFASKDRWDSGGGCSHPVLMHLLLRQIMMGRSLDLRKKSSPLSLSSVSARWCLDIGHLKPYYLFGFLFRELSVYSNWIWMSRSP